MYKENLVLDNVQGLICHKTQSNQSNWGSVYFDKDLLSYNTVV